jgi:hypothetical protein
MAKPRKPQRTRTLKIRLSLDEAAAIDARFIGHGAAVTFARAALLNQPASPRFSPERKTIGELARQVAWAGNNINQIARSMHSANLHGNTLDALEVAGQLAIIAAHLEEICKREFSKKQPEDAP